MCFIKGQQTINYIYIWLLSNQETAPSYLTAMLNFQLLCVGCNWLWDCCPLVNIVSFSCVSNTRKDSLLAFVRRDLEKPIQLRNHTWLWETLCGTVVQPWSLGDVLQYLGWVFDSKVKPLYLIRCRPWHFFTRSNVMQNSKW